MPEFPATWSMPLKDMRLLYMHEAEASILIGLEAEPKQASCPACHSATVVGYGKTTWRIRDLPVRKKAVFLEIKRRRLRCRDCQVTFNEPVPHVSVSHRATARLVQSIWKMALRHPFVTLSAMFGMDEKTIRNIFKDTFEATARQFRTPPHPPAPAALAIHLPDILRRRRVMWINLDQGTVMDMDPQATPESVRETWQRIAGADDPQVYLPPDAPLIHTLLASGATRLRVHPASMRSVCAGLLDLAHAAGGTSSCADLLTEFICAKSKHEAGRLWQDLLSLPPRRRSEMEPLIAAIEMLPPERFDAFDQPDHPCDALAGQLGKILNAGFSKRSCDVICAIVLFDKTLQKSVRTGVAKNGAHLAYRKSNYGTSISKLVARLGKLTDSDEPG